MVLRRACEFRTRNSLAWGKWSDRAAIVSCCPWLFSGWVFELLPAILVTGGWEARPTTDDVNGALVQADTRTTMLRPPR